MIILVVQAIFESIEGQLQKVLESTEYNSLEKLMDNFEEYRAIIEREFVEEADRMVARLNAKHADVVKELESHGLIERIEDPATGQVDYIRTQRAIDLEPALNALAEWAQHIVTFRSGAAAYVLHEPLVFKLHIVLGLTIFLLFPFTRLVHILSAPVKYLFRTGYQIVRKRA